MSISRMVRRARQFLLAGAVIGGLSFGVSQLFAGNQGDCPYPPYHGPCGPGDDCYELCIALFPENGGVGHCNTSIGCCICAER